MVEKAIQQPDCVQKNDVNYCKKKQFVDRFVLTVLFVGKLYLLNVKLPGRTGLNGSTLATAISLLFLASRLLMW